MALPPLSNNPPHRPTPQGLRRRLPPPTRRIRSRQSCIRELQVHTQARDVGWILRQSVVVVGGGEQRKKKYVLESLRGFDLFTQTAHVESVAVLRLVDC
jgi:hypothetical protein